MRFSQDTTSHGYTINAITAEGMTVFSPDAGAMLLKRSFVISAERLITDWEPRAMDQLLASHFEVIAAMKPEVVLLGTGERPRFPPHALLTPLMAAGIGYEVMNNSAACRTYNVLNGEDRRVVAALLLP